MNFKTIYIINWLHIPLVEYLFISGILVMISICIFNKAIKKCSGFPIIILLLIGFCIFQITSMCLYINNIYDLKSGNYNIVEGKIEKFIPANTNPKRIEAIKIKGVAFAYSPGSITGGLNHSIANQIDKNSYIRIYYHGDAILKVEKQIK